MFIRTVDLKVHTSMRAHTQIYLKQMTSILVTCKFDSAREGRKQNQNRRKKKT